ncbi:6-phosphogluconolactonase [Thraustotheca clavata]|uniref:6-phosphogluconolactonase n=1 Tax=Thraustotheca clavata TaxID=74557 RepID=A0A1W0A5M7_9STRA|nr:6-phosphogluconolactonase [Thraustotheca clavata]
MKCVVLLCLLITRLFASNFVFVGSHTNPNVPNPVGLTIYSNHHGHLSEAFAQTNITTGNQPTYMTVTQDRKFLYMSNEIDFGHVSSFAINDLDEKLTLQPLGLTPTNSDGPVHLVAAKSGKFVLIASYNIGSITVLSVDKNGFADRIVDQIVYSGGSHVVPDRQEGPHAHCVMLSLYDNHAFVTDLGNDKIMQYHFNPSTGKLTSNAVPFVYVGPGTLPRHMDFHPNGTILYLTTEYSNELKMYNYDPISGTLSLLKSVTTTKATGVLTGAIHVTSNGEYVLISNRYGVPVSDDSIVVYTSDLEYVGTYSTSMWGGPRDFTITDDGFVYITNENTNSIDTFRLQRNGQLKHLPLPQPSLFHPQVILPF